MFCIARGTYERQARGQQSKVSMSRKVMRQASSPSTGEERKEVRVPNFFAPSL
jgi:hypothetical protein